MEWWLGAMLDHRPGDSEANSDHRTQHAASLGEAEAVALRLILFRKLGSRLPVDWLTKQTESSEYWDKLCKPIRSYHQDIVVTNTSEGNLPLVLLCEPFAEAGAANRSAQLIFPRELPMSWEGVPVKHGLLGPHGDSEFNVGLRDFVALFPSGVVSYSVAFTFSAAAARFGTAPKAAGVA